MLEIQGGSIHSQSAVIGNTSDFKVQSSSEELNSTVILQGVFCTIQHEEGNLAKF